MSDPTSNLKMKHITDQFRDTNETYTSWVEEQIKDKFVSNVSKSINGISRSVQRECSSLRLVLRNDSGCIWAQTECPGSPRFSVQSEKLDEVSFRYGMISSQKPACVAWKQHGSQGSRSLPEIRKNNFDPVSLTVLNSWATWVSSGAAISKDSRAHGENRDWYLLRRIASWLVGSRHVFDRTYMALLSRQRYAIEYDVQQNRMTEKEFMEVM
ncbi:hypothetical protein VTL71DRAFT_16312 [Oculimacula yallundae]|uniref:Uncharacterized protein n=1 Tax=Oculimacula yallundae TaxID=86028 RepID=A0ABR4CE34_9HELO